ncbi:hypothetical protein NK718_02720 [Alsobacter sp. SYSU M60028]|uniref:HIT domain-containing protein n=1 Tax=Alsobacter ponti TaxID=2962936 RepID=A0ABT1L8Z2_9HYPH|nr:hypothetical protein [Alsobacter ponti]MCP8937416.1 hypothetical protein [Alsobacter ponti]
MRDEFAPRKINLASLGTAAPHLHVHIVPRFEDDPTFPDPVWNAPVRTTTRTLPDGVRDRLRRRLADQFGEGAS